MTPGRWQPAQPHAGHRVFQKIAASWRAARRTRGAGRPTWERRPPARPARRPPGWSVPGRREGEDLSTDLVGDGPLDSRVTASGATVRIWRSVLVTWWRTTHRHPSQRGQHTPDHDQHDNDDGAPLLPRHRPGASHAALVAVRPECSFMASPSLASGSASSPRSGDSMTEPRQRAAARGRPGNSLAFRMDAAASRPSAASAAGVGERWMRLSLEHADLDGDANPSRPART